VTTTTHAVESEREDPDALGELFDAPDAAADD
jgi:hypothetical protein